ncbi:cation-efflux pump [Candidatus Hakubella thermalkaliphila]|nr:cation-efflux pump [Candidatus Hakubella thermalkaliphila]
MEKEKQRVALGSVIAAAFLTAAKLVIGLLTGSLGILSQAADSGLDLGAATITYFAVRVSDRPADQDHLYGHGKAESLSALIQAGLLLITCGWIIYEAVERLFFKTVAVQATLYAFVVMGISIIISVNRPVVLRRTAKKYGSQALEAGALNFSSDVLSSAVVILGLIMVRLGLPLADSLAALVVATLVVVASVRLGKRSADVLLDRAPREMVELVAAEVRAVDGVIDCPRVRLRRSGNRSFVDLNVNIDRAVGLERAHDVALEIERRICVKIPHADVMVHTEPTEGDEQLVDRIKVMAGRTPDILDVHNILAHEIEGKIYLDLHLTVTPLLTLGEAHKIADSLEETVRSEMENIAMVNTHIESNLHFLASGEDITSSSGSMVNLVKNVAREEAALKDCHEVTVRKVNDHLSLTLHCLFDENLVISEVHEASTRIEDRVKGAIPDVDAVLVHVEPS